MSFSMVLTGEGFLRPGAVGAGMGGVAGQNSSSLQRALGHSPGRAEAEHQAQTRGKHTLWASTKDLPQWVPRCLLFKGPFTAWKVFGWQIQAPEGKTSHFSH